MTTEHFGGYKWLTLVALIGSIIPLTYMYSLIPSNAEINRMQDSYIDTIGSEEDASLVLNSPHHLDADEVALHRAPRVNANREEKKIVKLRWYALFLLSIVPLGV